MYAVIIKAVM